MPSIISVQTQWLRFFGMEACAIRHARLNRGGLLRKALQRFRQVGRHCGAGAPAVWRVTLRWVVEPFWYAFEWFEDRWRCSCCLVVRSAGQSGRRGRDSECTGAFPRVTFVLVGGRTGGAQSGHVQFAVGAGFLLIVWCAPSVIGARQVGSAKTGCHIASQSSYFLCVLFLGLRLVSKQ